MNSKTASLSNKKFHTNLQSHSKNSMINSLINQKLSEQKQIVKSRVVKLLKRASQDQLIEPQTQRTSIGLRKRANSLKNLNVSMQKIRESVSFNSMTFRLNTEQAQFIVSRQYKSSLISQQNIRAIASARSKRNTLQVKFNGQDKITYEDLILQTPQKKSQKTQSNLISFSQKVQDLYDKQLWLPGLPHTQMLLQNIGQTNQNLNIKVPQFDALPIVKSSVFSSHKNQFKPVIASNTLHTNNMNENKISALNFVSSKLLSNIVTNNEELIYEFGKYHKDDYLALEKWFEVNIIQAHKVQQSQKFSQIVKGKNTPTQQQKRIDQNKVLLNSLYSIHIGGLQEFIRLTYVESWHKALVFQKMFWSLIRLFSSLMEEQHKINYAEYKLFQTEIKQQRLMYQQRCQKLQIMMIRAQKQSSATVQLRKKLSMAYITYSRVNTHLCLQLQTTNKKLTEQTNNYQFLNLKLMKLVEYLQMEDKIKIISDQFSDSYFYVMAKTAKLQKLMTIPKSPDEIKNIKKKKFQKEIEEQRRNQKKNIKDGMLNSKQAMTQDQMRQLILNHRMKLDEQESYKSEGLVFEERVGQRIASVEHELNKYWLHKQDSLKIRDILDTQLMNLSTQEIGTSTYQKFSSKEFSCQFPQKQQKSFSQFLAQALQNQRTKLQKQAQKQSDLCISLQQLYQQSYEKIKILEMKRIQLTSEVDRKDKILQVKDDKINELSGIINLNIKSISTKQSTIENLLKQIKQLEKRFPQYEQKIQALSNKLAKQAQNSQNMVRTNLQTREKMQKLTFKQKQLQEKLKQLHDKNSAYEMEIKDSMLEREQFKKKYERLDKDLNAIAPAVDLFLEYRRYDKDSVVISNLKRDLEKYFADYFCKDADVFLTKG